VTERTLLHILIRQRGWTYSVFARAYERAAAELAGHEGDPRIARAMVSEPTFRRWTSGRVKSLPSWPAPQILQLMFQRPCEELLSAPGIAQETRPKELSVAPPVISESELAMTAREAAGHAFDAASQQLPDLTIDQLADDVRALAQNYPRTPVLETWQRGTELLKLSQTMLDRTQRARQRSVLYFEAGQAAAIMATAAFHLGSVPTAAQLARTASLYGEVIDHHPLQAFATGQLAYLAYWGGRPDEAVRLVAQARRHTAVGDMGRTRLTVIDARAHAHCGDHAAAVERLETVHDSGVTDELHDDIAGEFAMPPGRAAMSHSTTYLLLQDHEGAERTATAALEALPPDLVTQRAQAATDLARAHLINGDIEAAADAAAEGLRLEPRWRNSSLMQRMTALRQDLAAPRLREARPARELSQHVEDFTTSTSRITGPLALGPA
jgi:tetratricopeptide (TPR) repeat protein